MEMVEDGVAKRRTKSASAGNRPITSFREAAGAGFNHARGPFAKSKRRRWLGRIYAATQQNAA